MLEKLEYEHKTTIDSLDQKADGLIKIAEDEYKRHFADLNDGSQALFAELSAAVFGFVLAQTFSEDATIREIAYRALQRRFKWDDEYIATQVIGG